MSAPPNTAPPEAGLSSVKVTRGSGGRVDLEVKVYACSNDAMDVTVAEQQAQEIFDRLCQRYGGSS